MSVLRFLGEMKFDDDQPVVATPDDSGPKPKLRIMNKNIAPPEPNQFRVLLELTGAGSGNDRPGVDIVLVLDMSGSMSAGRLEKLKIATRILIKKLHTMDRLSVITFSQQGIGFMKKTQLQMHPLQPMTEATQKNIEKIVNGLQHVDDAPSIATGLEKALEVLNVRDGTTNRAAAIVLMSDGDPGRYNGDAAKVPLSDVPLYKFSFAHQYEADGLDAIGKSSRGRTFPLADVDDLSIAVSQCLAELCDIVVQDFTLICTPAKAKIDDVEMIPTIKKVYAGNCQQSRDDTTGSVTVLISGELYSGEIRRIMVDLLLPAISKQITTNVLQITHSYIIKGETFHGLPLHVDVIRTGKLLEDVMKGQKSMKTSEEIEDTKTVSGDNLVQNTGNLLFKQGQNLFKGALNAIATRDNKKENETQTSQAPEGENSDFISTDNNKLPKAIFPDISSLQGAGKYVIEQGQGARKYVIEQGQKIIQGEKLPDSDQFKGAGKYMMEQGQDAGKYVIDQGRKIFQGDKLPDSDQLKGTGKYVMEQGQDAGKYVIDQGRKIFQGDKLPDSDQLKGAGKYVMEQGQDAGKYVIDQGRNIFQRLRPIPGIHYKKENPSVPLEDQVLKIPLHTAGVEEKHEDNADQVERSKFLEDPLPEFNQFSQDNTNKSVEMINEIESKVSHSGNETESKALKQVITEPMINDPSGHPTLPPSELLDVDPVAHLKDQILTAIQYFNTIQDTLKATQDTLNKAST